MCISSQLKESAIRPNRSCANLALLSALVIFVSAVVTTVVTVLKTVLKRCNCSRSKSHFIRYCCVLLKTVTRSFVYTIGFFHNGGMLTSSNLDQRSTKFGSADTRCEQLIVVVLKFGRCKIATLKNHAIFFFLFFHFSASLANVPPE